MCRFFVCPRLNTLTDAVEDTLRTLEKTRRAFKSKDLADLRHRLLDMLGRSEKNSEDTKDTSQKSDI
ncbi:MAG: hypothetical protein EHM48_07610 [Planctomycetaceae bacterium]|nr:MAG: hypothetical protein EHM48_07610 [Planctomycetaceae bacterium]